MRNSIFFLLLAAGHIFADTAGAVNETEVVHGKEVFTHWCLPCHGPAPAYPGTFALMAKYNGTDVPFMLEQRRDLDLERLRFYVRHGVSVMPSFRRTEISDADLSALSAYLAQPSRRD